MKMWVYIFAVCLTDISWLATASPLQPDPSFTFLSTRQGLSQDHINDIVIDNSGFVWIATEGGLNRWDGYKVETISGPKGFLANASIYALAITNDSELWISTYSSGVYLYDLRANTFTQKLAIKQRDGTDWTQYPENFSKDESGNLVIPLYEDVYFYNSQSKELRKVFALPDELLSQGKYIRDAVVSDNTLVVATNAGLFARPLNESETPTVRLEYLSGDQRNLSSEESKSLLIDSQQRLWVGTVQGLFQASMQQVKDYLTGKSPILRGTFRMIAQASEVIGRDPRTQGVVFGQLTWSAGDHFVGRSDIRKISDLKGKKIAIQKGGPHVGMLYDMLLTARLPKSELQIIWMDELTGENSPAEKFRTDPTVSGCFVITPDMLGLVGDYQAVGDGTGGTVKSARLVVSTATLSRSIADVYACRKDYSDKNRDVVEKFFAGYLKGAEEVIRLKKKLKRSNNPLYKIAKEFGITHTQLNRIRKGENWGHIEVD